jgi:hypothetical protein
MAEAGMDEEIERLREVARRALEQLSASPESWPEDAEELEGRDLAALRYLPDEDRALALEAWRSVLLSATKLTSRTDLLALGRRMQDTLSPWSFTAEELEANPQVRRLTGVLAGTGPVLERPARTHGSESSDSQGWVVRAVDEPTARQWQLAAAKLPSVAGRHWSEMASGRFRATMFDKPLRGRLSSVRIGTSILPHRKAKGSGGARRGRRTKKDNARHLHAEMRTLYAVDEGNRSVWVTSVDLFKLDIRPHRRWVRWQLEGKSPGDRGQ